VGCNPLTILSDIKKIKYLKTPLVLPKSILSKSLRTKLASIKIFDYGVGIKENSFDMVQVEYNVMHHYTRQIGHIPRVIVFHDISTKVHERGMVNGDSNHKKSFEIAKRLEPEIGNKFDTVITLTEEDKLYLANLGCETKIQVIPPQINVPNIDKIAKTPNSICFVGSYNREPNIQAVEILINEVFPKISCSVSLKLANP
jgi:hypothetical protein